MKFIIIIAATMIAATFGAAIDANAKCCKKVEVTSNAPKGLNDGDSNNGAREEHPDIFATYEIVGDANGKALYRSEDGKTAIVHSAKLGWHIQDWDKRCGLGIGGAPVNVNVNVHVHIHDEKKEAEEGEEGVHARSLRRRGSCPHGKNGGWEYHREGDDSWL